jgi:hypothetical protein
MNHNINAYKRDLEHNLKVRMKKTIIFTVLASMLILSLIGGVVAPPSPQTRVHGFIYCKDIGKGWHVGNATVTVECTHGGTIHTLITTSDCNGDGGQYEVFYPETNCANDDLVEVTAEKDGATGSNSDFMGPQQIQIDVGIEPCEAEVPEFSAIAAGIALVGSGIGFLALRRKK